MFWQFHVIHRHVIENKYIVPTWMRACLCGVKTHMDEIYIPKPSLEMLPSVQFHRRIHGLAWSYHSVCQQSESSSSTALHLGSWRSNLQSAINLTGWPVCKPFSTDNKRGKTYESYMDNKNLGISKKILWVIGTLYKSVSSFCETKRSQK